MKRSSGIIMLAAGGILLSACTARHYEKAADKEAGRLIREKTPVVPNMDRHFTIEQTNRIVLDDLPVWNETEEAFGMDADSNAEKGARVLSLQQALDLAVKHSRTYQNRKEVLYLEALSLSLDRHRYTPIFSGNLSAKNQRVTRDVTVGIDTIVEEEHRVTSSGDLRMEILTRTGARIATAFSTDFLRFVTGNFRPTASSALTATLTQPLWRGAGWKIATENLTQAERDLLYALRDFTRFRKEFSVDIASAYYGVLQNKDAMRNSWRGLENFRKNVERERAYTEEGQKSKASLDQLKQAELQTESSWISSVRSYRQSLDQFKILLGIPADTKVILDDKDLSALKILHPAVNVDEAVEVALISRLDLETQRDHAEDAARKIKVAANSLKPGVDLVAGAGAGGTQTGNRFPTPDWKHYSWEAGVEVDLPFDRKSQRNSYRAQLINYQRSQRELDLAVDNIKVQIADGWRALDLAKRKYEISEVGVQIAERRVEEQTIRQELGRGTARDLVDAQNDLINSKNDLTQALVAHTLARLRFYRDMGILFIRDDGQWEEISNDGKK